MTSARDLAARRQLLAAQSELDRIELALAWHDLRRSLHLRADGNEPARSHPWVGRLLGFALPLIGATRARRLSRYVSLALLAYRIATGWRGRR
jgi:hypothetical protein